VQATLRVRDLVIASWETSPESVRKALPAGLEPTEVDGRFLVSIVAFHVQGGRLGRLPILPFAQLNVRTYVNWKEEPAVFFVGTRVTTGGVPGRALGAPYRQARLRVREGNVRADGLGVSLRFRVAGPADPGPLGRHELGLFENGGLRAFRIQRGEAGWRRAEVTEPARVDFLVALGLESRGEPELLYAAQTSFETKVPPERVSLRAEGRKSG
jgi:Uncharacterized conserved protein (COG2071)